MSLYNHNRVFRPLRGGIEIFNPLLNEPGTLGFLASAGDNGRWIVSCHHVLVKGSGDGEKIFQPIDDPGQQVAVTDAARSRPDLDCAAALLLDSISAVADVLGLGPLGQPAVPVVGMQVVKSGAATGITEGTIVVLNNGRVEIEPSGLPKDYRISDAGDSGAVWVAKGTLQPVALHQGGSAAPRRFAYGLDIQTVLAALNLKLQAPLAAYRSPGGI
jgi:hypothetical protein